MRSFAFLFSACLCSCVSQTVAFVATRGPVSIPSATKAPLPLAALPMVLEATDTATTILSTTNTLMLAETELWVQPFSQFLDPFLNLMSFAMLCRVVLSWYPETKATDIPWIIFVFPTEGLLRSVRGWLPMAFGVDVSPVFWLAIFTFVHEILLGQQGLLTMKIKYGI